MGENGLHNSVSKIKSSLKRCIGKELIPCRNPCRHRRKLRSVLSGTGLPPGLCPQVLPHPDPQQEWYV